MSASGRVGGGSEGPLVSICCLAYDQERTIRATLDGFLMQETSFPIEILVHDDASTDGTAGIIKEYEREHPDLIFPVYQAENQWSKGRDPGEINRLRARGKYLAFCEGDDFWTDPRKLEKQVDCLEADPGCGLVYTDFDECDEAGRRLRKDFFRTGPGAPVCDFENILVDSPFLAPCTWLFRRELTADYRSFPGRRVGDLPLLLWISARAGVRFLPETTAVYRVSRRSLSRRPSLAWTYAFHRDIFDMKCSIAGEGPRGRAVLDRMKEKFYSYWFPAVCLYDDGEAAAAARRFLEERGRLTPFRRLCHSLSRRGALLPAMRLAARLVHERLKLLGRLLRSL